MWYLQSGLDWLKLQTLSAITINFDELEKNRKTSFPVIPAEAGIQ